MVLDTSVLSPFARAERLADLARLTDGFERSTTREVLAEIESGMERYPALKAVSSLPWLVEVGKIAPAEIRAFAFYSRRLVDRKGHNVGEASVLAYAEIHRCVALVDDETAVRLGRERKVDVRRSLALIAGAVQGGALRPREAEELVGDPTAGGARYPCTAEEFIDWCRSADLL